jgi:hypothetical protein
MTAYETCSTPSLFEDALHTQPAPEEGVGAAHQGRQRNILSRRAARPHGHASGSGECPPSGLTPELHGREVGKGRGTGTSPASAERLVMTPHGLIAVLQQELAKWSW